MNGTDEQLSLNSWEWLEQGIRKLEYLHLNQKTVTGKIYSITNMGFFVRIYGIRAYLPLSLMPWKGHDLKYWESIYPTLEGKIFYVKIKEIVQVNCHKYHILVDATQHHLRSIALSEDVPFYAIVVKKNTKSVMIDIGCHFDWRYGSITGYIDRRTFAFPETFENCREGQLLWVYLGKVAKSSLQFVEARYYTELQRWIDSAKAYVGKTVYAKVCRLEEKKVILLIDNQYEIYPTKKKRKNFNLTQIEGVYCMVQGISVYKRQLKIEILSGKAASDLGLSFCSMTPHMKLLNLCGLLELPPQLSLQAAVEFEALQKKKREKREAKQARKKKRAERTLVPFTLAKFIDEAIVRKLQELM
ncbi:MAG: S1 RNA-binding domain-containing protein [Bacteroidales bacterium]|jgi:hypothetical protein|nr:S1 RNA-binding domain-containing protein [Bacteroidales bacterium]